MKVGTKSSQHRLRTHRFSASIRVVAPAFSRCGASIIAGLLTGLLCYQMRVSIYPGPGDFNWALDIARDLLVGSDPYGFVPSARKIPYPLPAALFGLPLLWLPSQAAAAVFFGASSAALAYGILGSGKPWTLLVFFSSPFFYALVFAQWSPLIMASWFFPVLAPVLVLVKPHTALPVAVNRMNIQGGILAGLLLTGSLLLYPTWPIRWTQMLKDYDSLVPVLTLPFGPILLVAAIRARHVPARLLLATSLLPFRGTYDLVSLWLLPTTLRQAVLLTLLSWLPAIIDLEVLFVTRPVWAIPLLFLPALLFVLSPWTKRQHRMDQA